MPGIRDVEERDSFIKRNIALFRLINENLVCWAIFGYFNITQTDQLNGK